MLLPKKPTLDDIAKLSQPNPTREAIGARAVHLSSKMADLPNTYRNLLPTTDDPKALEEAEGAIRAMHAEDAAKVAMMNPENPQPPDVSKFSPRQKIELMLRMGKPGSKQATEAPKVAASPNPLTPRQSIEFALNGGQAPHELRIANQGT